MQNPIPIISVKLGNLCEKLKTLTNSNSYLTMSTKGCSGFFSFCLDLELLKKNCKNRVCRNHVFLIFEYNSKSEQNKKNPEHAIGDTSKWKRCGKFQYKILNCRLVGARRNFQIFKQNTWFLEHNRTLSNFFSGILHCLISIIKL